MCFFPPSTFPMASECTSAVDAVPGERPGDDQLHPAHPHRPGLPHGPEVWTLLQGELGEKHVQWKVMMRKEESGFGIRRKDKSGGFKVAVKIEINQNYTSANSD